MDTIVETIGRLATYQIGEGDDATTGYKVWLAPEDLATSDHRLFTAGSLSWRDGRLPLTWSDNEGAHDDAVHVANLFDFQKEPDENGITWVTAKVDFDSDEQAQEARRLVDEDKLRGVSVHFADFEAEVECADEDDFDCEMIVSLGVIAAATIVIIPAFENARIEPLAASATVDLVKPPREGFDDPHLDGPTFTTVDENGRIYGHLTPGQDTCHLGFAECITPPYGDVDYEEFNSHARVVTDDGATVPVGVLTFDGPHAPTDRLLDVGSRMRHYDDSTRVAAYVRAGEDEYGTWVAGYLAPGLSEFDIEKIKRLPLSGDWLPRNGQQVLAAALAVPVPGFAIRAKVASAGGAMLTVGPKPPTEPESDLVLVASAIQSLRDMFGEFRQELQPVVAEYRRAELDSRLDDAFAAFIEAG